MSIRAAVAVDRVRDRAGAGPDVAVVIPAHNEETAISVALSGLLRQDFRGSIHIVVVANGCRDATAAVARSWQSAAAARGATLQVLELAEASKPAALNAGDFVAVGQVRVFLDADVTLSPNTLTEIVKALGERGCLLAAPSISVAPNPRWVADCYGRVWVSTPAVTDVVIGSGFYAVSAEGRARWDAFPRLISDDKFVRSQFSLGEQRVVASATMTVSLPTTLRSLVRVRTRWCRGNRELARAFPLANRDADRGRHVAAARRLMARADLWPAVPAAVTVYALGQLFARIAGQPRTTGWDVIRPECPVMQDVVDDPG